MKKTGIIFVVGLLIIFVYSFGATAQELAALEEGVSKEDLEVIESLDFLDDLDLLNEDLDFLEDYENIHQSESIGDSNE